MVHCTARLKPPHGGGGGASMLHHIPQRTSVIHPPAYSSQVQGSHRSLDSWFRQVPLNKYAVLYYAFATVNDSQVCAFSSFSFFSPAHCATDQYFCSLREEFSEVFSEHLTYTCTTTHALGLHQDSILYFIDFCVNLLM